MKIGLVSYEFINNDIPFNMSQIEKAMKFSQGKADFLCFGESFLQGFDSLNWNYEYDRQIAISDDSLIIQKLCSMTMQYGVDLLFGYIEKCGISIYSSCAFIEKGKVIHNYRRISKGWKEYESSDEHYKEGKHAIEFNRTLMINSISKKPKSHGGAFVFASGKTENKLPYDIEDIMIVEV